MLKNAMANLTTAQLNALLPSYGVTNTTDIQNISSSLDAIKGSALPYNSIPEIMAKGLHVNAKESAAYIKGIANQVKQQFTAAAQAPACPPFTLFRSDSRIPEEIRAAGGFWGKNDVVLSLEHARMHVLEINTLDWYRAWKTSTAGEPVPYVSTGVSCGQKGGNNYQIEIPLQMPNTRTGQNPQIVTDTGDPNTASVIALYLQGEEVLFLTGIPLQFITACNKPKI